MHPMMEIMLTVWVETSWFPSKAKNKQTSEEQNKIKSCYNVLSTMLRQYLITSNFTKRLLDNQKNWYIFKSLKKSIKIYSNLELAEKSFEAAFISTSKN